MAVPFSFPPSQREDQRAQESKAKAKKKEDRNENRYLLMNSLQEFPLMLSYFCVVDLFH